MPPQIPNIYTLGQVQVNSQPLVNLQAQLLAKQQAKDEALDKYFQGQMKDLSRKGIADNDMNGFNNRLKAVKDYWYSNKDNISRGGAAQRDFENQIEDLRDFIYKSTGKKEQLGKIYELKAKGDINDEDLPIIGKISAPLDDKQNRLKPDGTEYSLADFSAFVPLPDVQKQNSYWGAITQGLDPKTREYEKDAKGNIIYKEAMPGSFVKVASYSDKYNTDQLYDMANRAAEFVNTDKSFRKMYSTLLKNPTDSKFVELKAAYDQYFPGEIMDTPEELAKADAVLRFKNYGKSGQEKFTDVRGQKAYESALISGRAKAGGYVTDLSQYDILGPYTEYKGIKTKGFGGGKTLVYKKDVDPKDYELIADKDVIPFVDSNGDEYFEVDPNTGDWKAENATISASSVARRNLDRTTLGEEKRGVFGFKPGVSLTQQKDKKGRPPLSSFSKQPK